MHNAVNHGDNKERKKHEKEILDGNFDVTYVNLPSWCVSNNS